METFTDYYALLGVDARASSETIKAAFKKLALQYHPDVYKGADAEERMRLLLLAYQTLSDADERRSYDLHHAQQLGLDLNSVGPGRQHTTPPLSATTARGGGDRRFAFPSLDTTGDTPIEFALEGYSFKLWPDDALMLKQNGMLRGTTLDAEQGTSRYSHYCHRCHHRWTVSAQANRGRLCPNCKASDWDVYLLLRCAHCHAVFESREIRDTMRGGRLYFPYELFPLCPNCRRSQWCPAEDVRIDALRAADVRRRALLLLGAAAVTVLLMAAVLFAFAR
ncbi:MAG: hypothetical protein NVS3B14_07250 [Ktedonobacteraceae bacterium]